MTVVAVTGASGYLGSLLVDDLEERSDVRRVIGVDLVEPTTSGRNLEFYRLDVRSPAIKDVIRGADVLVHLAFVLPSHGADPEETRDVNVGGTRSVLAAAAEAGVGKVIHLSGVTAYGAHPDNDFPLTEDSPIRPVRDFAYSAHEAECEEIVGGFRESYPDVSVTLLRPAVVIGPTSRGVIGRVVAESPVAVTIAGYEPPVQFVHEEDVARAIVHAIDEDLDGAYNVAPDDWITQERYVELSGKRRAVLSTAEAERRMERMWRLGLSELPPSFLPFKMYPWVASNAKIRETGFTFLHSTEGAMLATGEAHRGWVSMGRLRFRPRNVVVGAAAAGLLAGSVVRRLRRRGRA